MEQFWHCCCFCFQLNPPAARRTNPQKTNLSAKQHRLNTKYKQQQVMRIPDDQRKNGKQKAYSCPICTNYYNKILACGDCSNCLCLKCFQDYDQKNIQKKTNMKCPFCKSQKSMFYDYELQPHSYFDTTNKGFLSKEQRIMVDNEFKKVMSVQLPIVQERSEQVLQINSQQ